MIKIEYVSLLIEQDIKIYYNRSLQLWMARFVNGEIMRSRCLSTEVGRGRNPIEALEDYVMKIKGKRMAFNASSTTRVEHEMPKELTV